MWRSDTRRYGKKSTSRKALLPRAADLATLAVVVAATWWSAAQRPEGPATHLAEADTPLATETTEQPAQRQAATGTSTGAAAVTSWPAQTAATLARDGLQAVGYQTRSPR
ncbi:MAG TPA: hypothetical protein PK306_13295 [Aquabacterium sp.]|nr:hypothetical protein [Aquabacterium sp.]HQC96676.1 hypothetical protein [Aquabacterium sp.]